MHCSPSIYQMSAGYRWSKNFDNGVKSANTDHEYVICFARINDLSDVMIEWRKYVAEEKERQLVAIIQEEALKEEETRKFIEIAFREGSVKTTGTDIDKLLPPMSRFDGGNRAEKKQGVITKLLGFFERFFGIG